MVGSSYDQGWKLLAVNGNAVTYRTDGMVRSGDTDGVTKALLTYVYDGNGKRAEKHGAGRHAKDVVCV